MGMEAPRLRRIRGLAAKLIAATGDGNWKLISRLDQEIAVLLREAAGGGALERRALAGLQQIHERARVSCRQESSRLRAKLNDLGQHREARLAYALMRENG